MIQVNDSHRTCLSYLLVSSVCTCVGRRDCMCQTLARSVIRRFPMNLIWLVCERECDVVVDLVFSQLTYQMKQKQDSE